MCSCQCQWKCCYTNWDESCLLEFLFVAKNARATTLQNVFYSFNNDDILWFIWESLLEACFDWQIKCRHLAFHRKINLIERGIFVRRHSSETIQKSPEISSSRVGTMNRKPSWESKGFEVNKITIRPPSTDSFIKFSIHRNPCGTSHQQQHHTRRM